MLENITLDLRRGRVALQILAALAVCLAVGAMATNAFASAKSPSASAAADKSLKIGYTAIPTNIAIIIAQEQGFYKKNGLNVKLTPLQCAGCALPALGKQYDIMTSTVVDFLQLASKGFGPIVVSGNDVQRKGFSSSALMVKKGITSYKQLKGKTIGSIAVGTGTQYGALLIGLKRAGLSKKDVKVVQVPFPNMLDQLKSGRIDAALAVDPYIRGIQGAGYTPLTNTLLAVTSPAVNAMWVGKGANVKKDKAKYVAFKKALAQTVAWMKTHDKEWRASIVSNLKLPAVAAANLKLFNFLNLSMAPKWIGAWVKPLEGVGLIKKGKIKNTKALIFNP